MWGSPLSFDSTHFGAMDVKGALQQCLIFVAVEVHLALFLNNQNKLKKHMPAFQILQLNILAHYF